MEPTHQHVVIARRSEGRIVYDFRRKVSQTSLREFWLPLRDSSKSPLQEVGVLGSKIIDGINEAVLGVDKVDISPVFLIVHFGTAFMSKEIDSAVRPIIAGQLGIEAIEIFDFNEVEDAIEARKSLPQWFTTHPDGPENEWTPTWTPIPVESAVSGKLILGNICVDRSSVLNLCVTREEAAVLWAEKLAEWNAVSDKCERLQAIIDSY